MHTIKRFVATVIAALALGVGSASAYAAQVNWLQNLQSHSHPAYSDYQVNWLQDHSRPAYSDDTGGAA